MVKIVALVKSLDGEGRAISVASLIERLRAFWVPDGCPMPDVRGLLVSEVLRPLDESSDVGAMVQLWRNELAEGEKGLGQFLPGSAGVAMMSDIWLTREHVFVAPSERERHKSSHQVVKLAGTAYRRDDFSREAFFKYWSEVHAPISAPVLGGGYVVSEILERLAGGSSADALVELWYPDESSFWRMSRTREWAVAEEHVSNYAKPVGVFWLMREHAILPPPPTGPGLLESSRV